MIICLCLTLRATITIHEKQLNTRKWFERAAAHQKSGLCNCKVKKKKNGEKKNESAPIRGSLVAK